MNTYYACCNANGPISVSIQSASVDDAAAIFAELDPRGMIDAAECDAEDDLGIDGAGMTEDEFASAMESAGFRVVRDLDPVHNHQSGTTANLAGGWQLFGKSE